MDINEIADGIRKGRYGILLDNGSEMTKAYVEKNFVGFADSLDGADRLCREYVGRKPAGKLVRFLIADLNRCRIGCYIRSDDVPAQIGEEELVGVGR